MTLQRNLEIWHKLLQASGGVLNPSKCVWLCFNWQFHPNGKTTIIEPPATLPQLQTRIGIGAQTPIQRLLPHEAHRYLGIYLTTDGNHQKELATYQQRQNKYISLLQNCSFPIREIQVIYKQCYLPMVGGHPSRKAQQTARPSHHHFPDKNGLPTIIPQSSSVCT